MLSARSLKHYFSFPINPVIKILTFSDLIAMSGFALTSPIFAVYLNDRIADGNLEVVGYATMIYLVVKSGSQLLFAEIIDRIKGERDDFWMMFFGSLGYSIIPLAYLFAETPMHIYIIQFIYGIFSAATFPSWMALFTRHADRDKEGMEWGIYYTATDFGGAAAAALGGYWATQYGFESVFILNSVLSFIGTFFLFFIRNHTFPLDSTRKITTSDTIKL
jgi:MFS family permease